jgi:hypothetical protein
VEALVFFMLKFSLASSLDDNSSRGVLLLFSLIPSVIFLCWVVLRKLFFWVQLSQMEDQEKLVFWKRGLVWCFGSCVTKVSKKVNLSRTFGPTAKINTEAAGEGFGMGPEGGDHHGKAEADSPKPKYMDAVELETNRF